LSQENKSYTVKDIANELGVSKPTINKAVTELNLKIEKIGNRFVLNEEQFKLIKSKITQKNESERIEKTPNSEKGETEKIETGSLKTEITQIEMLKSEIKSQKSTISFLEEQIGFYQQQLIEKDNQINSQLSEKDKQISALHEQNKSLTDALVAAQTLHAATIQTTALVDKSAEPERKWWQKIFKKKEG